MNDKPITDTNAGKQSKTGAHIPDKGDGEAGKKKNEKAERALDEAIEESFPASDPIAVHIEKTPKSPGKKSP